MANIHTGANRYRFAARCQNLTREPSYELAVTTPDSAAWSSCASSSLSSTTRRPPPSVGIRMTSLRCSRTTSIGPSPVRGFIAAITVPFYTRLCRDANGRHFSRIIRWNRVEDFARLGVDQRSVDHVFRSLWKVELVPGRPGRFGILAVQLQNECLEYLGR